MGCLKKNCYGSSRSCSDRRQTNTILGPDEYAQESTRTTSRASGDLGVGFRYQERCIYVAFYFGSFGVIFSVVMHGFPCIPGDRLDMMWVTKSTLEAQDSTCKFEKLVICF